MAVSRPLLFVLIAALALLAVVTGMRALGGGQEDGGGASAPAAQSTTAATSGTASAQQSASASPAPSTRPRRAAAAKRAAKEAKDASPQERVLQALAQRKVVVLFFGQYHSAEDRKTRNAVRAVGRETGVVVTVDLIENVAEYPRVVSGLGIQQSPSTAVIDKRGSAQVVEGFLDKGSLRQLVADARS